MIEAGADGVVDREVAQDAVQRAAGDDRAPGRMMPVKRLATGLMEMSSNSVRDIPIDAIIASTARDRISIDDGIEELAESIRKYGQQVPILVRPLPRDPERYQIVYGRRRLAAVRHLGDVDSIRAIVRSLRDEEAIVAQGQENSLRLDPSHIEKALFARELRQAGYDTQVIVDALGVDRFTVSRLVKVADDVPGDVIEMIGACHDVGRRPWRDFADLIIEAKLDASAIIRDALEGITPSPGSSERFRIAMEAIKAVHAAAQHRDAAPEQTRLSHGSTRRLVGTAENAPKLQMQANSTSLTLSVRTKDNPKFRAWLEENIDDVVAEMQARWLRETESG